MSQDLVHAIRRPHPAGLPARAIRGPRNLILKVSQTLHRHIQSRRPANSAGVRYSLGLQHLGMRVRVRETVPSFREPANQLRAEGDKMKDDFLRKPIRISAPFSPPREKGWG
jgi:hypothetical protein